MIIFIIIIIIISGWANGVEYKPIEGLVHLAYPYYQSVVPFSMDQYPASSQQQEDPGPAKKVGEGMDTEMMRDTPTLEGLILHYQSDTSPTTKRKVDGLVQAQAYKQKYFLSDRDAVSMVPDLMQFPEDD